MTAPSSAVTETCPVPVLGWARDSDPTCAPHGEKHLPSWQVSGRQVGAEGSAEASQRPAPRGRDSSPGGPHEGRGGGG